MRFNQLNLDGCIVDCTDDEESPGNDFKFFSKVGPSFCFKLIFYHHIADTEKGKRSKKIHDEIHRICRTLNDFQEFLNENKKKYEYEVHNDYKNDEVVNFPFF